MSKIVAYLRTSTEDQHLSIDAQRAAILAYAPDAQVFIDEGVSGALPLDKRPALLSVLDALEPGSQLVVTRRDRLARDVLTAAIVEKVVKGAGATIHSLAGEGNGEGPEHQLMRAMLDAFAAYERAIISLRIKAALRHKRANGEVIGQVGYGYRREGDVLTEDSREQELIARAKALHASGLSLRAVSRALDAEGLKSRTGRALHAQQIARLIA